MSKQEEKKTQIFKPDTEGVLVRGLNAMTKACDALSKQNEQLNIDVEALKRKISRLQDRILTNQSDRE
jgi:chaperonin cofactor prefoldin